MKSRSKTEKIMGKVNQSELIKRSYLKEGLNSKELIHTLTGEKSAKREAV